VDLDDAGLGALAEQPQGALAGRQADVVDIEGDGLGDARAGVERDARQSAVTGEVQASTARSQRRVARLSSARGAVSGRSTRWAAAGPSPQRV
jgi:hypothetical protein